MEFIDLNRQYEVIGREIERRIKAVVDRKHFIMGEEVEELESDLAAFTGRKYAFSCSSGTSALIIPLMAYQKDRCCFCLFFYIFCIRGKY